MGKRGRKRETETERERERDLPVNQLSKEVTVMDSQM